MKRLLLSAILLCGCPRPVPPPDLGAAPDLSACTGWPCTRDRDCPPSLCPGATAEGHCAGGECTWP